MSMTTRLHAPPRSLGLPPKSTPSTEHCNWSPRRRVARPHAVCIVSMAELLYAARNADELARLRLDLSSLSYLHMTPAAEQHVADVMAALALRGHHRTPIPDLMLAARAHAHSA